MTVAVKKYWSLERCGYDFKPNKKQFVLKLDLSVSGQPLTERSQLSGIFSPPLFSQCRSEIAVTMISLQCLMNKIDFWVKIVTVY